MNLRSDSGGRTGAIWHWFPEISPRPGGFRDLRPWYDLVTEGEPIGEVWLTGDNCLVATGPGAGKRLAALFSEALEALLGADAPPADSPLLIKTIFAREKLSVQVHPDDKMAQKYGQPRGKTECWYVLAAESGAEVALGVKLRHHARADRRRDSGGQSRIEPERGARGGRRYDFCGCGDESTRSGRGLDSASEHGRIATPPIVMFDYGMRRELHIQESLEATKLTTRAGKVAPRRLADRSVLIDVEYFRVERIPVEGNRTSASLCGDEKPGLAYLFAAVGSALLTGAGFEPVELQKRGIVAVPAVSPEFVLEDTSEPGGALDLIRIKPNWPAQ